MSKMIPLENILSRVRVAPEVFELRPDYRALLMVVDGIPPGPCDTTSEALLQEAEASARRQLTQHAVIDMPHVAAWRDAYKAFGAKPQRTRNSLEALTRRVEGGLPRVNRLTDIYNAISVKHQIPLGGEDLNKYEGAPRLIRATGKENFETVTSGDIVVEHPDTGEVVWCDDVGVTSRRWNWRQGPRTALTDSTTRALFILDALSPVSDSSLHAAAEELTSTLKELSPDVRVERRIISISTR
ncbi:Phenylalanyl-tRNA synthetase [Truncatella angustata]|uniref:Phenylalanyl-tRNA synthetase n=1 Tax=Truncatella angustata TaxID=152316 RepID=A0A9P8ZWV5_9PEZI|nr:Phenylalanyl-tRNA synthetase [Truncatella angustata]KAH6652368.1 Phenylalanyl-tRNA synthetase [Truncatella angustata]